MAGAVGGALQVRESAGRSILPSGPFAAPPRPLPQRGIERGAIRSRAGRDSVDDAEQPGGSVEREVITLNVTLPFGPGVVPCAEERVNVSGDVPVRIHTTIDGRGGLHQMASYNWKDVVATGAASGNTWHTTAAQELYTTFNHELTVPFKPVPTPVPR